MASLIKLALKYKETIWSVSGFPKTTPMFGESLEGYRGISNIVLLRAKITWSKDIQPDHKRKDKRVKRNPCIGFHELSPSFVGAPLSMPLSPTSGPREIRECNVLVRRD